MLNRNLLRGKMAEKGMTQEQVANAIGITSKTFCIKMKTGKFGLDEAEQMIELLDIEKPELIFFSKEVS